MSWEELLTEQSEEMLLPWYGPRRIHSATRTWTLRGRLPLEHGWHWFRTEGGRSAYLITSSTQPDPLYENNQNTFRGYLVGDRFIPDLAHVEPDPDKLIAQTERVFCIEPGLDRFTRITVVRNRGMNLVFIRQEFPLGPEYEALIAFQDRKENLDDIRGVTPSLDLAFRWITYQRELTEERRRELERLRQEEERKQAEEERLQQAMKDAGTAVGRRVLAAQDFEMAAKEALRISGAELLDVRESYNKGEMVVQYRFRQQRLECVVEKNTLRIIDAGVCLTDERTGFKGDSLLTLESLPGTVGQALDEDRLVIWRHAD